MRRRGTSSGGGQPSAGPRGASAGGALESGGVGRRRLVTHLHATLLNCNGNAKLLRCLQEKMPPHPQPLRLLLFYSSVTVLYWSSAGEEWQASGLASHESP